MQQPSNETILFRLNDWEQQMKHIQEQVKFYVQQAKNESLVQSIEQTIERIERDMFAVKRMLGMEEKDTYK